jgi:hypothetical protein
MAFSFPRQLCAMSDSDEEMQLMTEVALLDEQLKKADCPYDANIYAHLFKDLEQKPVEKRVRIWRWRKGLAQKFVDAMLSSSSALSSGETAARNSCIKQETEPKRKFEEPPYVYPAAHSHAKKKPKFSYFELSSGSAPLMSPIHVAFAQESVALLRENPGLIGPELIAQWNTYHAKEWNKDHANRLPKRGRCASGRADNFFNNGYFVMPQLQKMARGELPLPIANTESDGANVRQRERARAGADGADAAVRGRRREGATCTCL